MRNSIGKDMKFEMLTPPEGINNYTYMVECADGSLYTGWTNNLSNRIEAHNAGNGAKYTKTRLPVHLVYYEISESKQEAMSKEWHWKKLNRADKEKLIRMGPAECPPCDRQPQ